MEALETPRLIIRPFTMDDLDEAHQMLDLNIQWTPGWKAMFWPQLFLGIDPQALDYNSLELGIGYALSSPHRGQGYATEAVRALLDHAFTDLQFERLFAVTDRDNGASISLMRRVGMRVARNPNSKTVYPGAAGVIERF